MDQSGKEVSLVTSMDVKVTCVNGTCLLTVAPPILLHYYYWICCRELLDRTAGVMLLTCSECYPQMLTGLTVSIVCKCIYYSMKCWCGITASFVLPIFPIELLKLALTHPIIKLKCI